MFGLGNGRRGMKSPPLLVAVLLAAVLVLGINYWISNSRSIELQSRVMELEGRMRRAAAERGAVEIKKNEFEEKLEKQKGQIEEIQTLHLAQLETFETKCSSDKAILVKNLTFKDQMVTRLQGDFSDLAKQYDDLQKQLEDLRDSQSKKLNFELEQCSNKMKEISDLCEERLKQVNANVHVKAALLNPVVLTEQAPPKEPEPQKPESIQQNLVEKEEKGQNVINVVPNVPNPQILDKEVVEGGGKKSEVAGVSSLATMRAMGAPEAQVPPQIPPKGSKDLNALPAEKEPNLYEGEDHVLKGDGDEPRPEEPEEQQPQKENDNEEVEREQLLNMDEQEEKEGNQDDAELGNEEEDTEMREVKLPDYNGEEGNEPEPEAKKQAELAGNEIHLKGPMANKNVMKEDQQLGPPKNDGDQRLK